MTTKSPTLEDVLLQGFQYGNPSSSACCCRLIAHVSMRSFAPATAYFHHRSPRLADSGDMQERMIDMPFRIEPRVPASWVVPSSLQQRTLLASSPPISIGLIVLFLFILISRLAWWSHAFLRTEQHLLHSRAMSGARRETWSKRLRDHCAVRRLGEPTWQDVSDRRGGRTAWSSIVAINGTHYSARFFYDGSKQEAAREDAAEMALRALTNTIEGTQEPPPASYYARG
ncbi:hypothetical protein K491DRAFT_692281 [Lophiostoma macrostomum CBS 122681]|uniref:DRBM domain-containing protein n=1 Tax=Lophiostoma macrostomum CBS 122681 TaxID=1314788 RepID=A0A6A6T8F9_9PLEO|nr:hypothetical protein K491DRAFT_692281 [Lophiostoma macrostomum CBS 122681]